MFASRAGSSEWSYQPLPLSITMFWTCTSVRVPAYVPDLCSINCCCGSVGILVGAPVIKRGEMLKGRFG